MGKNVGEKMWVYKKMLEFPVDIKRKDLKMAKYIMSQLGGPSGELAAALRYLSQRYTMPDDKGRALLTDIGTEELAHCEIICAMLHQLTDGATPKELEEAGLGDYYTDHRTGIYPSDASGNPFNALTFNVLGDPISDLAENMAAEQKARTVYENLMNLTDDPDLLAPLSFLRQREVIHYQRFKELFEEYSAKALKDKSYLLL